MVKNIGILGLQWGDEGKGKIVDLLMDDYDVNVRFQGGSNAGHTVKFGKQHYALHLIPSGILHPGKICILGNGMVIDPEALEGEMTYLTQHGIAMEGRLFISDRAHLVLPHHKLLDQARETALQEGRIGTTGKGIGPTYETKVYRYGLRTCDLIEEEALRRKVTILVGSLNDVLNKVYDIQAPSEEETVEMLLEKRKHILPYLADTAVLLNSFNQIGKRILFEGAQGMMLDIDHGTYPFVTSSNCTIGGLISGSGVTFTALSHIRGVLKAYTTRVGGGPFPTELHDRSGDELRRRGNEFGTTTGRPRRTGWLDLVVARYAVMLNGIASIALTKLDVLDSVEEIPICVRYRIKGTEAETPPASEQLLAKVTPEYEHLPGWGSDTTGITQWKDLPPNARRYVEFIESYLGIPIPIISTGPRREETIVR